MFARQSLALIFAAAVLAGCGASAVPSSGVVPGSSALSGANVGSAFQSLELADPNSTPKIRKVSPIQAAQYQTIIIKGRGFGKMTPYNGNSCCIKISVTNVACTNYVW